MVTSQVTCILSLPLFLSVEVDFLGKPLVILLWRVKVDVLLVFLKFAFLFFIELLDQIERIFTELVQMALVEVGSRWLILQY